VVHVHGILELQLPVPAEQVFVDAAAEVDLTLGRAVAELVDRVLGVTEMLVEARSLLATASRSPFVLNVQP
jgi:hypothetical protein